MPKFDIDDLSFFRVFGYGLRHTAVEWGKREQQEGADRGDAVSMANYGLRSTDKSPVFNEDLCRQFQEKIEQFILDSFKYHQKPHTNYKQASFLILRRDNEARSPYDFSSYPLGKCGTSKFNADQVELFLTSEGEHYNEDVDEAAARIVDQLVDRLHQLKKLKAEQILSALDQPHPFLNAIQVQKIQSIVRKLIFHYEQQTEITSDVFLQVCALVGRSPDGSLEKRSIVYYAGLHYFDVPIDNIIAEQQRIVDQLDVTLKKTGKLLIISPVIDDLNELSREPLKRKLRAKLSHYIQLSNIPKIEICLNLVGDCEFDSSDECPVREAACNPNFAIFTRIYERYAAQYEKVFRLDNNSTPIFLAAYSGNLRHLEFLIAKQNATVLPSDLSGFGKHILINPLSSDSEQSLEIVRLLLEAGCTIGNDIKNFYKNPLALCATSCQEHTERKLSLLLPKADALAKYTALRAIGEELSLLQNPGTRSEALQTALRSIVISCNTNQCQQIAELCLSDTYPQNKGKETLEKELAREYDSAVTFGKDRIARNIKDMGFAPPVVPSLRMP